MCGKVARSVGILRKLKTLIPSSIISALYFSLIQSHLSYGITCWGGAAPTNLSRLHSLQKRAVGLFPGPLMESYSYNSILMLNNLYHYFGAVKLYKYHYLSLYQDLFAVLPSLRPSHDHLTRHSNHNNFNIPLHHTTRSRQSLIFNASKNWNTIPTYIKESESVASFRKSYKNFLLHSQAVSS